KNVQNLNILSLELYFNIFGLGSADLRHLPNVCFSKIKGKEIKIYTTMFSKGSPPKGGPTGTCGFPGGSDASYGEFFGFSKVLFSNIFDGGFDSPKVKTGSGQPYTRSGVQYIVIASGFHIQTTCPSCNTKISSGNRCSTCSVIGQVKEKKPITIDISADKGDAPYGGGYIVVLIDGDVESKVPEAFTI
ncbi:235_t:CDS:2, partial [Entrophospora sp. SA101]